MTASKLAAALLVLLSSACYRYGPVQVSEMEAGSSVRVRLSGDAVDRFRNGGSGQSNLLDGFSMTGRLTRVASDSVMLEVPTTVMEANVKPRTLYQGVALGRAEIQNAEIRRIDRARTTWLAVGLGAATITSIVVGIQRSGRGGATTPPGQGPPEIRIPLGLRFQIR
jgi:hypothetical protein